MPTKNIESEKDSWLLVVSLSFESCPDMVDTTGQ